MVMVIGPLKRSKLEHVAYQKSSLLDESSHVFQAHRKFNTFWPLNSRVFEINGFMYPIDMIFVMILDCSHWPSSVCIYTLGALVHDMLLSSIGQGTSKGHGRPPIWGPLDWWGRWTIDCLYTLKPLYHWTLDWGSYGRWLLLELLGVSPKDT